MKFADPAFSCRNDPTDAQITEQLYALDIVDRHLRTGMNDQIRESGPGDAENTQILHQNGIRTGVPNDPQCLGQLRQLLFLDQCVYRHVDSPSHLMRCPNGVRQALFIKVSCIASGRKGRVSQVNGICTCRNGSIQSLSVSSRR